jgi:hypothetical protein
MGIVFVSSVLAGIAILVVAAPAFADRYACVSQSRSAANPDAHTIQADEKKRPFQITVEQASSHDQSICIAGAHHTGFFSAYCAAPYVATVDGLGPPLEFYGDSENQFRGLTPLDYLVIYSNYYLLSFYFTPLIIFSEGDCEPL